MLTRRPILNVVRMDALFTKKFDLVGLTLLLLVAPADEEEINLVFGYSLLAVGSSGCELFSVLWLCWDHPPVVVAAVVVAAVVVGGGEAEAEAAVLLFTIAVLLDEAV